MKMKSKKEVFIYFRLDQLLDLKVVHLESYDITHIDNIEQLTNIECLYLQFNNISWIENISHLSNSLELLALQGNRIKKIENLSCLRALALLDLSNNQIKTFEVKDFPS